MPMRERRPAELVLGSVQLGMAYGVANRTGKPERATALSLVSRAADAGVTQFDTARAYGDSEERIGEALQRKAHRAITKLSPLSELPPDASQHAVRAAVEASVSASLVALKRDRLDCLLLHRAEHMRAHDGAIWERLIEYLEQGVIEALGVSVQSPDEALQALDCKDVRHIQLPFNLLDWRWRAHGVIDRVARRADIVVHARSAFLQGLLAANDPKIWPRIANVDAPTVVTLIAELAQDLGRASPADLCLAYARGQSWIDGVVVGLETEGQLETNLRLFVQKPLSAGQCALVEARMPHLPVSLLDPAQWPR
jgi:aryl-alcohol dehydrogenase-like predicted oxidoreductase